MLHLQLDGEGSRRGQLERALRDALLYRQLDTHAYLPSTRALAAQLGLSRNTVVAAYEQLAAEGLVLATPRGGFRIGVPGSPPDVPAPANAAPARLSSYADAALDARAARPPGRPQARTGLRWDLAYGSPWLNPALMPAWRRALTEAAARIDPDYPPVAGDPLLRSQIASYLGRRRGIRCTGEDVIVVAGTQQAIELCARALLQRGDVAVLEDPHYQGARIGLICNGARIVHVATDGQGLITQALPRDGARLICVTPSHQFPRGGVLSHERRIALLEWAGSQNAFVIEDDYDGEFRFDARPLPTLKAMDRGERVIYAGTLSKVMWPGLRLGYLVVPPALQSALLAVKWVSDRGCAVLEQAALASLMAQGVFERHLRRATLVLGERRSALLAALQAHLGNGIDIEGSEAGMHVLVWLRNLAAERVPELIRAARERGLGVYPIGPYFAHPPSQAGLLIGFAHLPPGQFDPAIRVLADSLRSIREHGPGN